MDTSTPNRPRRPRKTKTRTIVPVPTPRTDRIVHGVNIDAQWRLFGSVAPARSVEFVAPRTAFFYRQQAIAWLGWALGKDGFGDRAGRATGKNLALHYLAAYRQIKAGGGR